MSNNYKELAKNILEQIGGTGNIVKAQHCATRLRINVKDKSLVHSDKINEYQYVLGSQWSGNQFQIIFGDKVTDVYNDFVEISQISKETPNVEISEKNKKITLDSVLQYISGAMIDTIPGMLGCAFIAVILSILTTFNLLNTESSTYQIMNIAGTAFFSFFPIIVGSSAAKRIGTNEYMAMAIGAVLSSAELAQLFTSGSPLTLFGLPVTAVTYASTVFPILMIVPVLKVVYDFFGKYTPGMVKIFVQPLLTLLVMLPIALCVLGPIGGILGNFLASGVDYLYQHVGILAVALLCALYPLLVMTGMHYALIPICTAYFVAKGFDPLVMVAMIIANMAQGSAAIGVSIKSKNIEVKELGLSTGISCILAGITEPALYGINLRYKTPLIAASIGGGLAGLIGGIFQLKMYGGVPNIFGLVGFFGSAGIQNFYVGLAAVAVALVTPAIIVQFIYKEKVGGKII